MVKFNVGADAPEEEEKKTIYALSFTYCCLYYVVFGLVLARPSQNKLIWYSDAVCLFVVEWRQNIINTSN